MPRYFFHLHNDVDLLDEEGVEHENDHSAIESAIESAREVAASDVRQGRLNLSHCIVVMAADGRAVGVVTWRDAIDIESD